MINAVSVKSEKFYNRIIFLFVTLLVMNGLSSIPIVFDIARYTKIVLLFLTILLIGNRWLAFKFVSHFKFFIGFWILCLFFFFLNSYKSGWKPDIFIANFTFIFYFFFLFSLTFRYYHNYKFPVSKDLIISKIVAQFGKALNFNFIFWTVVGFGNNFSLWHRLEDRVGLGLFYKNYLQLGIFALSGAIVYLLIFKIDKKNKKALLLFIFYSTLVILSNSRNAQLILFFSVILIYFDFCRKTIIRYRFLFISLMALMFYYFIAIDNILLNKKFIKITTGRSNIWNYVFDYFKHESIFFGKGIFGLNSEILKNYSKHNYYFQRIDFLYFHSSYVEVFAAAGIVGFVFFFYQIIKMFRNDKKTILNSILISVLIGSFFESFLLQPIILISFLFWLIFFVQSSFLIKSNIDGMQGKKIKLINHS